MIIHVKKIKDLNNDITLIKTKGGHNFSILNYFSDFKNFINNQIIN